MVKIKRIRVGAELEFFAMDEYGNLVEDSNKLIKKLSKHLNSKIVDVQPEVGKSMVELNFQPAENMTDLYKRISDIVKSVYDISESLNLIPYIAGTYPGKAKYKMRRKPWYSAKKKLFGDAMANALKVSGFHFHYTLPSGIVNKQTKQIQHLKYAESKNVFLNLYNFNIAADPALITLAQSSPYFEGKYVGKDSRVIVYRDFEIESDDTNEKLKGLHSGIFSFFGGLPNYEFTLSDINWSANKRKDTYVQMLRKIGYKLTDVIFKSPLSFMWSPIRVNKIGTLEYRGMDSSDPKYLFLASSLLGNILSKIIEEGISVLPSDIGSSEPFKFEDGIIFLPPFSYVKSIELLSSLYGLGNTSVMKYVKSLINLSKKLNAKLMFSDLITDIFNGSGTNSDKLIKYVVNNSERPEIPEQDVLKFVSLKYAEDLRKSL